MTVSSKLPITRCFWRSVPSPPVHAGATSLQLAKAAQATSCSQLPLLNMWALAKVCSSHVPPAAVVRTCLSSRLPRAAC